MFRKVRSGQPAAEPPETPVAAAMTPFMALAQAGMMNPFAFMPWTVPPAAPTPATPSLSPLLPIPAHSKTTQVVIPSSDPPDMDVANPYPEICDFITDLDKRHPRRMLFRHIAHFEDNDYYNIDEILKLESPAQLVTVLGMSPGNAQFLWDQVKAQIKQVDRTARS